MLPGPRTGQQLVQYSVAAVTGRQVAEMFNEGVRPGPHRSGTHTTSTCGSETSSRSVATRGGGRGGVAVPDRDAAGSEQGIEAEDHIQVWLLDDPDPRANLHLDLVVRQTVAIADLRRAGKVVTCTVFSIPHPFHRSNVWRTRDRRSTRGRSARGSGGPAGFVPERRILGVRHALSRGMRENSQPTGSPGLTPSTLTATLGAVRLENREP